MPQIPSVRLSKKELASMITTAPAVVAEHFQKRIFSLTEVCYQALKRKPDGSSESDIRGAAGQLAKETARKEFDQLLAYQKTLADRQERLTKNKEGKTDDGPSKARTEEILRQAIAIIENVFENGATSTPVEEAQHKSVPADEDTLRAVAELRTTIANILVLEKQISQPNEPHKWPPLLGRSDKEWEADLPTVETPFEETILVKEASLTITRKWGRPAPFQIVSKEEMTQEDLTNLGTTLATITFDSKNAAEFSRFARRAGIVVVSKQDRENLLANRQKAFVLGETFGTIAALKEIRNRLEKRKESFEKIKLNIERERSVQKAPETLKDLMAQIESRVSEEVNTIIQYAETEFHNVAVSTVDNLEVMLDELDESIVKEVKEFGKFEEKPPTSYNFFTIDIDALINAIGKVIYAKQDASTGSVAAVGPQVGHESLKKPSMLKRSSDLSSLFDRHITDHIRRDVVPPMLLPLFTSEEHMKSNSKMERLREKLEKVKTSGPLNTEAVERIISEQIKSVQERLTEVSPRFLVTDWRLWRHLPGIIKRIGDLPRAILSPFGGIFTLLMLFSVKVMADWIKPYLETFVSKGKATVVYVLVIAFFSFVLYLIYCYFQEHRAAIAKANELTRKEFRKFIEQIETKWKQTVRINAGSEVKNFMRQIEIALVPLMEVQQSDHARRLKILENKKTSFDDSLQRLEEAVKTVDDVIRKTETTAGKLQKSIFKEAGLKHLL